MTKTNILRNLWLWTLFLVMGTVSAEVKTLSLSDGVQQPDGSYVFTLDEGEYTTYGTTEFQGKALIFEGSGIGKTIWRYGKNASGSGEGASDYSFDKGANVTFKNLTLKDNYDVNSYYRGFVRPKSMHFENCEFLNMIGYFGDSSSNGVWFKDCVFNVNKVCEYCVKTYGGSDFYFDGCTFNAANKGFIQLYIQDNSKTHNAYVKDCSFNKVEGNTATMKTAVYWYNYNGSSEGADWNICFAGNNINNAGISANATSGTWMYEWKYTNTATVYNNGVCVMNEGVAQTITESEVPSSVAQTVADVAVTKDETATEVESSTATEAVNNVVANTATVNATTEIAAESVEDVTSTKNYLHIDVKTAEVAKNEEQAYVKSMTFDIKPIAATITDGKLSTEVIPNSAIKSAITFRLPVDANATETTAEVFHNGESMGADYQVQGTTEKYIEVSTTSFSEFGYQLLDAPAATYVAQIGETKYETLADAVAAVQNDETITLTQDITLDAPVLFGDKDNTHARQFTVDFNEKTVTGKSSANVFSVYDDVTFKGPGQLNGTPQGMLAYLMKVYGNVVIDGVNIDDHGKKGGYFVYIFKNAKLTLESGTLTSDYSRNGVVYSAAGGQFVMNGGKLVNNYSDKVSANASCVNVAAATSTTAAAVATINGGEIQSAVMAVYIDGIANITEANVTAPYTVWVNKGTANISGGKFYANPTAVYLYTATSVANISGGEFWATGTDSKYLINKLDAVHDGAEANITGGIFHDFDPMSNTAEGAATDFTPDNKCTSGAEGVFTVGDCHHTVEVVGTEGKKHYDTLAEAITAVPTDGTATTIQMLADHDVTAALTVANTQNITLDLNGKTVKNEASKSLAQLITVNGKLTIDDSSTDKDGKIQNTASGKYVIKTGIAAAVLTLNNGTIETTTGNSNGAVYGTNGAFVMTGGKVIAAGTGVTSKNVNISGGQITATAGQALCAAGTITGGTFTSTNNNAVYANQSGTLEITGGNFTGVSTKPTINIYTTDVKVAGATLNNGVGFTSNATAMVLPGSDDAYLASTHAAFYDGETLVGYAPINTGLLASGKVSGKTVKLTKDVATTTYINVTKSFTLDLNSHNITCTPAKADAVILTKGTTTAPVELTIKGEGKVSCGDHGEGCNVMQVSNYSTVNIEGGEFSVPNDNSTLYMLATAGNSVVNISGGEFKSGDSKYILKIKDDVRANNTFNVTGGTFHGFNPADNNAEGEHTNFVAEGYESVDNGDGTWTVMVERPRVAAIGDAKYLTLAAAVAAATSGETITMLKDVDITTGGVTIAEGKNITLDLNGHDIKAGEQNTNNITVKGKLTLVDNSTEHNGKIYTEEPYSSAACTGVVRVVGGEFVMNSGNIYAVIESDPANKGQFGVVMWEGAKVTINGGQIKAGWYAVSENGTDQSTMAITINGGELISTTDYAIYQPAKNSSLDVTEGVVYGAAGAIAANGGTVNVTGGTITSKGQGSTGNWGDGTGGLQNAAIIANAGYNDVAVTISGGTITAEGNALTLANGTTHNGTIAVSGGSFSSAIPAEYCALGFVPVTEPNDQGLYEVKELDLTLIVYTGSDSHTDMKIADFVAYQEANPNAMALVSSEYEQYMEGLTNVIIDYPAGKAGHYYECENFVLDDWYDWYSPVEEFVAVDGSYSRGLNAGLTTICVPFDVVNNDIFTPYVFHSAGEKTAYFNHVDKVNAGEAFLAQVDASTTWNPGFNNTRIYANTKEGGAIRGTYRSTNVGSVYKVNTAGTGLVSNSNVVNYPFRAYFDLSYDTSLSGNQTRSFRIAFDEIEEGTTGISAVGNDANNNVIYNAQGLRMNKIQNGLNIVNGKKILK